MPDRTTTFTNRFDRGDIVWVDDVAVPRKAPHTTRQPNASHDDRR